MKNREDFLELAKCRNYKTGCDFLDSGSKLEYAKKTWDSFKNQKKQHNISVPQWWSIK